MRRLEGVIHKRQLFEEDSVKKYLLLFDRLHLTGIWGMSRWEARAFADIEYLSEKGVGVDVGAIFDGDSIENKGRMLAGHAFADANPEMRWEDRRFITLDVEVRIGASLIKSPEEDADIVPIYRNSAWSGPRTEAGQNQTVLKVALKEFPMVSPKCPFEDILAFKQEMHDKQWDLRRFLHSLATKKQTEGEVRDDIEWTLNEYTKAMKIHHLKAGNSFAEVYVIPVIELVEDLAKFNWSKIAKGALGLKKRRVELMEAEMKG